MTDRLMNEYDRGKKSGHKFVALIVSIKKLDDVEEEALKVLKEVDAVQYSIGFAKGTLEAIAKRRKDATKAT